MSTSTHVLIPGAWMGAWIWRDTVTRLTGRGIAAMTLTLSGLSPAVGQPPSADASTVGLLQHVHDVIDHLDALDLHDVVLVGHSYSGLIAGMVADRLGRRVRHTVYIAAFLPRQGRCLLADWGHDPQQRRAEMDQVRADGMRWAPPPAAALELEQDLGADDRRMLNAGFVDHPGRTVLEAATLDRPVTSTAATYVATAPAGQDPLANVPAEVRGDLPERWRLRTLTSGHWPMLSAPDAVADLIVHAHAAGTSR
ncbi:alpha/beta fold hydrolase [Kineococcus sp. SYSU DK018]|uniref:alpha/beta fold hydrolase n=1 Tax=Kineococcus sp. SYSU DK018 TaxID=3383139 RepID=UPI003D7DA6A5